MERTLNGVYNLPTFMRTGDRHSDTIFGRASPLLPSSQAWEEGGGFGSTPLAGRAPAFREVAQSIVSVVTVTAAPRRSSLDPCVTLWRSVDARNAPAPCYS